MAQLYTLLSRRDALLAIIFGLLLLLVLSNLYWYFLFSSSNTVGGNEYKMLRSMLANISEKYDKLLNEKAALQAKYEKLLKEYNDLQEKIAASQEMMKKLALYTACLNLNKSITGLVREVRIRTMIGNYTRLLITPPQMIDTLSHIITGTRSVMDAISKIYAWVENNITDVSDQPFLTIRPIYFRVGNTTIIANISYRYVDRFIQSDIETLERGAGDTLDKTILLTSLLREYLGQTGHGNAYFAYMQIGLTSTYAVIAVVEENQTRQYLILDLSTGVYGPCGSLVDCFSLFTSRLGTNISSITRVAIVNDKVFFEASLDKVISFIEETG